MSSFIAAIAALAATALASPAMAYVVEVTTSIDLTDVADKAQPAPGRGVGPRELTTEERRRTPRVAV